LLTKYFNRVNMITPNEWQYWRSWLPNVTLGESRREGCTVESRTAHHSA
jgi:hypothetical protein